MDDFVFKFFDTLSDYFDTDVEHTWVFGDTNPTWPCDPPIFSVTSFTATYLITTDTLGYILAYLAYEAPSPAELLTIPFGVYFYDYYNSASILIGGS